MNLRTPLRRQGTFIGLLTSVVPVAALSRSFAESPLQDVLPDRFILYGKDHVLAHRAMADGSHARSASVALPSLAQVGDPVLASIWREDMRWREIGSLKGATRGHILEYGGAGYTFFYRSLDGYGPEPLIVGAYVRPGPERDREIRRVIIAAVSGVAVLIASVLAALFFGRWISRPVTRLASAARGVHTMENADLPPLPRSIFRELDDAAVAFNDMRAALKWFATYVPKKLVARLVAQGEDARVESEERRVTVLFTDIEGFTGLSEQLSGPETAQLLNEHFSLLATCVDSEGGIIDKFIGDSLMAFWGPPLGGPDHAEAACRAAIAMRDTMRRFNERRRMQGTAPIRIRIGIHTGPAIVGNIGAPGRTDFTVIGDTVNLAQRLEQMVKTLDIEPAERDAVILLSADVVNGLDGPYALISLGIREIPGRDEGLMVFRLK
jgi:class 3 adenylate cyclase